MSLEENQVLVRARRWRAHSEKRSLLLREHKGDIEVGSQWGAWATPSSQSCVDKERDLVTEVHSDTGSDEVNPDHPLGLLCHNFFGPYLR